MLYLKSVIHASEENAAVQPSAYIQIVILINLKSPLLPNRGI